jgi:hypothetical protein
MERYVGHKVNVSHWPPKVTSNLEAPFPHNKLPSSRLLEASVASNDETRGKCFAVTCTWELTQHGDRDRLILSGQHAVHHVVAGAGGPRARCGETLPIGVGEACRIGTVNLLADRPRRSGRLLRTCSSRATCTGRGRQYLLRCAVWVIVTGIEHECHLHECSVCIFGLGTWGPIRETFPEAWWRVSCSMQP